MTKKIADASGIILCILFSMTLAGIGVLWLLLVWERYGPMVAAVIGGTLALGWMMTGHMTALLMGTLRPWEKVFCRAFWVLPLLATTQDTIMVVLEKRARR